VRGTSALPKATFGPQDLRIAEARVWVLPNPSGLNRRWSLPALVAEYSRLREVATNAANGRRRLSSRD